MTEYQNFLRNRELFRRLSADAMKAKVTLSTCVTTLFEFLRDDRNFFLFVLCSLE